MVDALGAFVEGDLPAALRAASDAASGGDCLLGAALAEFLSSAPSGPVYEQPAAFEAFIGGGGNVALYREVHAALAGLYEQVRPRRLLDLGCGDGAALVPALHATGHPPERLELVEPSAELLGAALRRIHAAEITASVRAWQLTAQSFVADSPAESSWPLVQSTFALHTLPHQVRSAMLIGTGGSVQLHVDRDGRRA